MQPESNLLLMESTHYTDASVWNRHLQTHDVVHTHVHTKLTMPVTLMYILLRHDYCQTEYLLPNYPKNSHPTFSWR